MDLPPSTPRLARFVLPGPALAPQRHLGPGTEVRYPPANFATVAPGIFRSSFPNRDNFEFLRSLGLKSVLYVPAFYYTQDIPLAHLLAVFV